MPTGGRAVKLLEELGLTEYEPRCFVALSRVQKATAKEVSELSEVPRSRVYDAVDRLHKRGLVDVQQTEPREYLAISPDDALETLREEYTSTVEDAGEALAQLQRSETQEQTGAWAIADHDHVTDRIEALIGDAQHEVFLLVVDDDLVEDRIIDALEAAADRGVSVVVELPSQEVLEAFETSLPPESVNRTALADRSTSVKGKWLGRIVMVDRDSVLLSSAAEGIRPGRYDETAIWASGADHGLVVGLRHLLGTRIDEPEVLSERD